MNQPWNEGVKGTQVRPLINDDSKTIIVEAGPGTGKTFGLVRRVERILHPSGLAVQPENVLVVAFNRVIAQDLRKAIERRLKEAGSTSKLPVISTIHALCRSAIGKELRLLMDHEREPLIYDVLQMFPELRTDYDYKKASQSLALHEANLESHPTLWQGVERWLIRHKAALLSDLPQLLLNSLKGGDFTDTAYDHVIVDEYQDLTAAEQELFRRLTRAGGSMVALGDPRQSIYAFRGNDRLGLGRLANDRPDPKKITMTECQRCPNTVVEASNRLMSLSGAQPMVSTNPAAAEIATVHWLTPQAEAKGMAKAIVANLEAHPQDRHLVMVTRRQFGTMLRRHLRGLRDDLDVEMNFSEDLLESWAAREAFLFLSLMVDPDAPTWRAWFSYQNSDSGKKYRAPKRSSPAYLRFLADCDDIITVDAVERFSREAKPKSLGEGTKCLHQRALRFASLKSATGWDGIPDSASRLDGVFDSDIWVGPAYEDADLAREDLRILLLQCKQLLADERMNQLPEDERLTHVLRDLRYLIATREPMRESVDSSDAPEQPRLRVQIATLWGAKGVTADHVYVIGLCEEAIPGERESDYPGTAEDHREEQRRLFYVSITRTTRTLVLSRPKKIQQGDASKLRLTLTDNKAWGELHASPFLRDILPVVPDSVEGDEWLAQWAGARDPAPGSEATTGLPRERTPASG